MNTVNKERKRILRVANLELNQLSREVKRAGKYITLTKKEYSLLEYFMLNAGIALSRASISENVWPHEFFGFTNVIDVYVKHLRDKMDMGFKFPMIRTIRGVGYMLRDGK